jgi:hypothetical protein
MPSTIPGMSHSGEAVSQLHGGQLLTAVSGLLIDSSDSNLPGGVYARDVIHARQPPGLSFGPGLSTAEKLVYLAPRHLTWIRSWIPGKDRKNRLGEQGIRLFTRRYP